MSSSNATRFDGVSVRLSSLQNLEYLPCLPPCMTGLIFLAAKQKLTGILYRLQALHTCDWHFYSLVPCRLGAR